MAPTASSVVEKLNLKPNPEGGVFSETFRDTSITLSTSQLPPEYKVDRPISTAIYYLLSSGSVSLLHRIPSAETWHFYLGEPLTVLIAHQVTLPSELDIIIYILEMNEKDGRVKLTCIGQDIGENQQLQYTVPPYVWFGVFPTKDFDISEENAVTKSAPRDAEKHFSLVGCTVAPAFQFEDFELAKRSQLVSRFPAHESLISLITISD